MARGRAHRSHGAAHGTHGAAHGPHGEGRHAWRRWAASGQLRGGGRAHLVVAEVVAHLLVDAVVVARLVLALLVAVVARRVHVLERPVEVVVHLDALCARPGGSGLGRGRGEDNIWLSGHTASQMAARCRAGSPTGDGHQRRCMQTQEVCARVCVTVL
jgi:hypothetical protein